MRLLILLFAISRLCDCSLPYYGVTVGITPYSRPVVSQYHRQDNHGNYVYGYATDLSSQDEVKTPDGVTRGGYSYIDANGILQTVQYISDPVNGFRVLATNIPTDLPEVAHARAQHLAQFEHIKEEHALIAANRKQEAILSVVPAAGSYIVPVKTQVIAPAPAPISFHPIVVADSGPVSVAPVAAVVPIEHATAYTPAVAVSSQYHAQDNLGQYSYGYADPNSAKSETKTADGVTRGGYSYIDANGVLQTVHYVSDPVNGFRVTATNLPQAPSVTLIGPKVTTTVVGPQDNNVVVAAAPAAADTVIAPVDHLVPVHSTTHIDSIGIEQKPILVQPDIVPNANVPAVSPEGPYIHLNPNHDTPTVYANPELTAPFEPPQPATHINPQIYAAAPIPVTHSQAVLHNKEPIYNIPPAIENQPELSHHAVGQPIHPVNHHQQYAPQAQPEQVFINAENHGPSRVHIDPYAHDQQAHVQYPHAPQQILIAPSPQPHYENPHIISSAEGHVQPRILLSQSGEHVAPEPVHTNQQVYITPDGRVSNHGQENQQIFLAPEAHQNQQILLAHGNRQDQIYADPNHVHAGHSIQLPSELQPPSHDQRTNYYAAGYAVPINAEAINNGPSNQQVLNHEGAHSRLTLQPGDSSAYEGAYTYGGNTAYGKQLPTETRPPLFVPSDAGAAQIQQVYQHQAPVEHGPQVVTGHEQAFQISQREYEHARQTIPAHDIPQQHQQQQEQQHATAPSGYYTQNIQY